MPTQLNSYYKIILDETKMDSQINYKIYYNITVSRKPRLHKYYYYSPQKQYCIL